ncbi:AraC family transcriptional regulator [Saccharibacillus sacchari]|uniref:AraC family transcriptional regulator n=1 Tax=Saccharibacillus sacchari TaxID=456493 RepID=UPI00056763FF|nr:AraC family transcriptional regulator [Saccharibacillus sacchari]
MEQTRQRHGLRGRLRAAGMPKTRTGRYYRRSLILILLIVSIPGLVTGIVMHQLVVTRMEQEFNRMHQSQIETRARNVDDQLTYLEMSLSHWAFEPRFGEALRTKDFVYDFKGTAEIVTTLYVLEGSHPLIRSAQLYLDEPKSILFNREYTELTDRQQISQYAKYLNRSGHVYWTDTDTAEPSGETISSDHDPLLNEAGARGNESEDISDGDVQSAPVLVHKIPGDSTDPFGTLIITLDQGKVSSLLKTLTPYDEGTTFLMNAGGRTLASGSLELAPTEITFERRLKQAIADRKGETASFLLRYGSETYSVSYGPMSRVDSDWTYVSAAPMSSVTAPLKQVSTFIVLLSGAGLLLGLVLSWYASRRIYSPVARMLGLLVPSRSDNHSAPHLSQRATRLDEFELLESQWQELTTQRLSAHRQLEEQLPQLRESFMLQLIRGHLYAYDETGLRRKMQGLGFHTEERQFLLLEMAFTGHARMEGRFGSQDTGLMTFAAANMIEEMAREYPDFEQIGVANFHDLSAALLIVAPQAADLKSHALLWGEELLEAIGRVLKMNVTLVIGRSVTAVKELPGIFAEMERLVAYRSIEPGSQLLDLEDQSCFYRTREAAYPLGLENELIQAIRRGRSAEAEHGLERFMAEATRTGGTEFQLQQIMLQLLGSIQHTMLQTGAAPYRLFGDGNRYEKLSSIREPEEMKKWMMQQVISPYAEEIQSREEEPMRRVVDSVIEEIRRNYKLDISLESCAESRQVTPYALSKAFKQEAGVNFIDYLTRVRMDEAKRLLRETTMKINDIAIEVGYQPSYFNRIFKKREETTPSQYRERWSYEP